MKNVTVFRTIVLGLFFIISGTPAFGETGYKTFTDDDRGCVFLYPETASVNSSSDEVVIITASMIVDTDNPLFSITFGVINTDDEALKAMDEKEFIEYTASMNDSAEYLSGPVAVKAAGVEWQRAEFNIMGERVWLMIRKIEGFLFGIAYNALSAEMASRYEEAFNIFLDSLKFDANKWLATMHRATTSQAINKASRIIRNEVLVEGGAILINADPQKASESAFSYAVDSFLMMKTEVTQKDYTEIIDSNPVKSYWEGDTYPMHGISWVDAVIYANKLSKKDGLEQVYTIKKKNIDISCNWDANGWRLPTEAEWEYAARGGEKYSEFKFAGSDSAEEVAWYKDNSGESTNPVGTKLPNELGIHDLSGNVWEWCWNWIESSSNIRQTNPIGPQTGEERIVRGGGWYDNEANVYITSRNSLIPTKANEAVGFRLVRKAPTPQILETQIIDHKGSVFASDIPEWVEVYDNKGISGIELLAGFNDKVLFVADETSERLDAARLWANKLSTADVSRLITLRIREALDALHYNDPNGSFFALYQRIVDAAKDKLFQGLRKESDYWLCKQAVYNGDIYDDRMYYHYYVLFSIDRKSFIEQLDEILASLITLTPATTEQQKALDRFRGIFEKAALPAGEVISLDNFEDGNYWAAVGDTWDQWGIHNLSLEAELSAEWGTDGPTSADWVYDTIPVTGGQATFFCDQLIETNWTGVKYVAIDIKNPEAFPITICFNAQSTDGWAWTQTQDVVVNPGENTDVVFDLTKGCMDGSNAPIPGIPGPEMMKRAMFTVRFAGDDKSGRFYADNIRIIK